MAMDWNTGNNPWGPGGKMTAGLPWAQQGLQGMQHGWQQAGGFFAPKSQAQIQREALLQLAILAAVVAAPALLGAGGGAASTSTAATAATKTAATTNMVEGASIIAPTAPIVTTGTAATVTGASAASGLGAAALMPFIGAAALQNLLGAAAGGPQVLNQALQQQAPATRPSFVFDPGQAAPQLDKDGRHPAMPMLEEMAGKIGKDRMLELSLRRALATGNLTGLAGQPAVMGLVAQAVRAIPPGNPWAGDFGNPSNISNDCFNEAPDWRTEWFENVGVKLYVASILAGFSSQGGLLVIAHAYKERATSETGRTAGYASNNWWGLTPIRNLGESACESSRFACFPTIQGGFDAYFRRMTTKLQITNALAPDFNPSYPDFGNILRKETYPSAEEINTALRIGTGNFVFCYPCLSYGEDVLKLLPSCKADFEKFLEFKINCLESRLMQYNRFGGNSPMFDFNEGDGEQLLKELKEILASVQSAGLP